MTSTRTVRTRGLVVAVGALALLAAGLGSATSATAVAPAAAPNVPAQAAVHVFAPAGGKGGGPFGGSSSSNLTYGGGTGGIGVETAPKVYLVLWGSQWGSQSNLNDPSHEAAILQGMLSAVGGSSWLNSVTQYCQGITKGTSDCSTGVAAGNPSGMFAAATDLWVDNATAAPTHPKQSQLAAEAIRAAGHFVPTSNASTQYIIATATGNSASGFGTRYCAWHSSTSSSYGTLAYTNLPYITDAGASCGANFNGLGATAGITIVEGHELAETITDQFPSTGWTDGSGAENGDKCAWISSGQGATASIQLVTGGTSYPMQSLWSNAFNNGKGACVLSY